MLDADRQQMLQSLIEAGFYGRPMSRDLGLELASCLTEVFDIEVEGRHLAAGAPVKFFGITSDDGGRTRVVFEAEGKIIDLKIDAPSSSRPDEWKHRPLVRVAFWKAAEDELG
jgi:hypothetical protein